jgi:hypothetical protein
MAKKVSVKESAAYENFVGKKEELKKPEDLFDVLGIDVPETEDKEANNLWTGMPAFEQKDNPPYKTLYVHFRNKNDFEEFSKKYKQFIDGDQTITEKTKPMWYPHLNREENAMLRWIEETNEDI